MLHHSLSRLPRSRTAVALSATPLIASALTSVKASATSLSGTVLTFETIATVAAEVMTVALYLLRKLKSYVGYEPGACSW